MELNEKGEAITGGTEDKNVTDVEKIRFVDKESWPDKPSVFIEKHYQCLIKGRKERHYFKLDDGEKKTKPSVLAGTPESIAFSAM